MSDTRKVIYFKYSVKDSSGKIIDQSGDKTITLLEGTKKVFPIVEAAMLTAELREKHIIQIPAKEGYGDYDLQLVVQVPEAKFRNSPKIGSRFKVKTPNGKIMEMSVVDKKEGVLILDGNHPLAGKNLIFEVEVLRRRPAQEFEIETGQVRSDN